MINVSLIILAEFIFLILFHIGSCRSYVISKTGNDISTPSIPVVIMNEKFTNESDNDFRLIEGDIAVLKYILYNGNQDDSYHWPGARIPYKIDNTIGKEDRLSLVHQLNNLNRMSCLKYVPKNANDKDYILFLHRDNRCYSYIGRNGGAQILNMPPWCIKENQVAHEALHAAGFYHEQSRSDRDNYISIVWKNIVSGLKNNFEKFNFHRSNVSYDYGSVMHYPGKAFSKNGEPTIVAKDKRYQNKMGYATELSKKDIIKLNAMYCDKNGKPLF